MKRSPMKRGKGFQQPAYEPKPKPALSTLKPVRQGTYTRTSDSAKPIQKHAYVRSPKLLQRIRELNFCCFCLKTAPVMPCHGNWGTGKGMGIKADDSTCAAGCQACHTALDQGSTWSKAERKARHAAALELTVGMLMARDQWPAGVPLP